MVGLTYYISFLQHLSEFRQAQHCHIHVVALQRPGIKLVRVKTRGGGIDTKSNGYCNLSMSRSQYLFAIKKTKAGESNGCFDHVTLYHTVYKLVYMGPSLQGILRPGLYFQKKANHGICSYSQILASLPLISGLDITLFFPIHKSIRIFKKNFCIVILRSTKILFLIGLVSLRSVT